MIRDVSLTERAAEHVRRFTAGKPIAGLRLKVKTTGCSGYAYVVEIAEQVDAEDEVFESRGVKVLVEKSSLPFLVGTEIDYTREGLNSGFKFQNPNVKASCGCGESFTV